MRAFDYVNECIMEHRAVDMMFGDYLLESLQAESDFLLSCYENNIILEAENNEGKMSWWAKLKAFFKRIWEKFYDKVSELLGGDEYFIKEKLPKLTALNNEDFADLKVNLKITDYTMDVKQFTNLLIPEENPSEQDLKKWAEERNDDPENTKQFGGKTVSEYVKFKLYGWGDKEPDPEEYSGTELKSICLKMKNYVENYNNRADAVKQIINALNNRMNNIERAIEFKEAANESTFSILENAFYSDTDLVYCHNYKSVMEAEEEKKDEEKVNTVVDTAKEEDINKQEQEKFKGKSTLYLKYMKDQTKISQIVITTIMSCCEEAYHVAIKVLKGVIKARVGGKVDKKSDDNKVEDKKSEETKNESNENKEGIGTKAAKAAGTAAGKAAKGAAKAVKGAVNAGKTAAKAAKNA